MAAQAKYTEVMEVIQRRIRQGDYLINRFPGERRIAEETGVSYMTARKAVLELIERRVLLRGPSRLLDVHPTYARQAKPAQVVLLYPAYPSAYHTQLRGLVAKFAQKHGVALRPVPFLHWDETTVLEAVEQARGTLLIPSGPEIPLRLAKSFKQNKVVVLDGDFTSYGLPSIRLFTDASFERVLDYLRRLGHLTIDCINTHSRDPEIDRRILIWRTWIERHRLAGELSDAPAPIFNDPTAVAVRLVGKLLDNRQSSATALIAATCPSAVGAVRAAWKRQLQVGRDLSIAAMNIEPPAEFFCPSITGLNTPNLSDVLGRCFDWFLSRSHAWRGARLLEPKKSSLFKGESTGKRSLAFWRRPNIRRVATPRLRR